MSRFTEELWPVEYIAKEYKAAIEQRSQKPFCVLLSTGALCPIHRGHVDIMVRAKKAMEKHGYHVLGGWLSPSHDLYVGPKMRAKKELFLDAKHRAECVELAVQDFDWLSVATWESRYPGRWPDFPEVKTT
mmetsp:Transcript_7575/g.10736  ORF Transcript_7575/g.10736 Transcript_7575/m.10736 type:complete len:131 (+) Transcript_7575:28-420(+)